MNAARIRLLGPICLLSLVGAWGAGSPAQAQLPETVSVDDAVSAALTESLVIKAALSGRDVEQAELRAARAPTPMELLAVPAGTFNDSPIIVTQQLDLLGKRRTASRVSQAQLRAAGHHVEATRLDVARDTRLAYTGLQEALDLLELMQRSHELREALRRLAEGRFELGDVARVDVDRLEIERDRAREDVTRAQAEADVRRARLNSLMGRDPNSLTLPSETLSLGSRPTWDSDALAAAALRSRPDLKTARALLGAREASLRAARASRLPDFEVQLRTGTRVGSPAGTQIGLGLTMPVVDWGQRSGATRAARASIAEKEAQVAELERVVRLELVTACRSLVADYDVAVAYSESIATRAETVAELLQLSYERGGSTLLEVIDAERTLTATQVARARATAAYRESLTYLTWAAGGALPESTTEPQ